MTVLNDPTASMEGLAGVSAAVSILVALLAGLFAGLALAARRKRPNPALAYVAAAFGVFGLKNAFSAVNVTTHVVPHDGIELILSLCDLAILAILFTPFVRRKRDQG